jgi:hypothetical protein
MQLFELLWIPRVGRINGNGVALFPQLILQFSQTVLAPCRCHYTSAITSERHRDCAPDSARRAGDEHTFILEFSH